jgi:hypothetical protein
MPPPYQVMKPHPPTAGTRPGYAGPVAAPGTPGIPGTPGMTSGSSGRGGVEARLAGWWNSLQQPLAMRVSQGMALVIIWMVLVVVFLAYLVGHHLGVRVGRDRKSVV